jgi:hypothetical protein
VDLAMRDGSSGAPLWERRGELATALNGEGFSLQRFTVGGEGSAGPGPGGFGGAPREDASGAAAAASAPAEEVSAADGILSLWA